MDEFDAELDALSQAWLENSLLMVELDKRLAMCQDSAQVFEVFLRIRNRVIQEMIDRGDANEILGIL
jgi:hypothetical protein